MNTQPPEVRVTARHARLTQPMKEYAATKLQSIEMDFPRALDAHVVLDVQRLHHRCMATLTCTRHVRIQVSHEDKDIYKAIDLCMDKLARRMRKCKTRVQGHDRRVRSTVDSDGGSRSAALLSMQIA